jgi:Iap family predicted aminopeptidase
MKKHTFCFFGLIFGILLFQGSASCQPEGGYLIDPKIAPLLINEISGERTHDYITRISRFHRIRGGGPGSGYNDAVDYVMQELNKFGLDDVHVERFRSDGFATYLRWQSPVGWRVRSAQLWLVEPQEELLADFSDVAVSLMAYSNGGEAEAEVVFVGNGRTDADYQGKDVKGKIVFATAGDGNGVHRKAVIERGALGVAVGPSDREDRLEYPDLVELNRLNFSGEERSKAGWGFSLSRRQTNRLLRLIERGTSLRMHASVDADLFDGEMPVVSALIKGQSYPDEEILIMGHLDHYKPGANDNASGSAGMIEIARMLTHLIQSGKMERPYRSIRFLWLPEMHGAMAYADAHPDVGEHTLAGINLDMIGEDYEKCKSFMVLTRPPFSSPSYLGDVVEDMFLWVDRLDFHSSRGSYFRLNYRDVAYSGGSDHVIFTDPTIGVPSLMLGHADVFHHTSYDTPDKCDPTELRRVTTAAAMAALVISNAEDEKALDIAAYVATKGLDRMHQQTRKSMADLRDLATTDKFPEEASAFYRNALRYTEIIGSVEKASLESCKELCRNAGMKKAIDQLSQNMNADIKSENTKLELYIQSVCKSRGFQAKRPALSELEKKAKAIIPKRLFRGPLPFDFFQQSLGEGVRWHLENIQKAGSNMGDKMFEIANFTDGSHDLLWIRDAVSAEFGDTDVEFVIRYVEDMKKLRLMDW